MKRLSENSVLLDLFNVRTDGFETLYEKRNKKSIDLGSKIADILNNLINDDKKISNIQEKLEELFLEELNYWNFAYYKLGIADGINLYEEITQESQYWEK